MHACNHWINPSSNPTSNYVDPHHWNRTCGLPLELEDDLDQETILNPFSSSSFSSSAAAAITTATSLFIREEMSCHEMIPLWWAAAGTIIAIFLIEYDRFLAIRYPLLYPEMVSDERSVFACVASQIGCLCLILSVRHISPESFVCEEMVILIQVRMFFYFL